MVGGADIGDISREENFRVMTAFIPVHPASRDLRRSIPGVVESKNPLLGRGKRTKEYKRKEQFL
jgi:hypothetical protein